jgi:hypothetical protein
MLFLMHELDVPRFYIVAVHVLVSTGLSNIIVVDFVHPGLINIAKHVVFVYMIRARYEGAIVP